MTIPGVMSGATVGNRWTPETSEAWRDFVSPGSSTLSSPGRERVWRQCRAAAPSHRRACPTFDR